MGDWRRRRWAATALVGGDRPTTVVQDDIPDRVTSRNAVGACNGRTCPLDRLTAWRVWAQVIRVGAGRDQLVPVRVTRRRVALLHHFVPRRGQGVCRILSANLVPGLRRRRRRALLGVLRRLRRSGHRAKRRKHQQRQNEPRHHCSFHKNAPQLDFCFKLLRSSIYCILSQKSTKRHYAINCTYRCCCSHPSPASPAWYMPRSALLRSARTAPRSNEIRK